MTSTFLIENKELLSKHTGLELKDLNYLKVTLLLSLKKMMKSNGIIYNIPQSHFYPKNSDKPLNLLSLQTPLILVKDSLVHLPSDKLLLITANNNPSILSTSHKPILNSTKNPLLISILEDLTKDPTSGILLDFRM
jgi:hypothetical protein